MKKFLVLLMVLGLAVPALAAHNVTTLGELVQDVKNNMAIENDPYLPDTVIGDLINLGLREIAAYGLIEKLDTILVAASDNRYDLNDDFLEAVAVYTDTIATARGLDRIDFKDWGKIAAAQRLTEMKYFAIQHEYVDDSPIATGYVIPAQLWLYPAPTVGDSLFIHYYAEANEITADADTSNIPYFCRNLVVFYATALAFARAQEYDRAAWWASWFDQTLNKKLMFRKYGVDYLITPKQITK